MKKSALLTLIIFSSVFTFSQETSIINLGIGYPIFFQKNFISGSGAGNTHSMDSKRINLMLEIPDLLKFKNNPNFFVTPGVSYNQLNESKMNEALGGSSIRNYKHQAYSLYAKLIYEINTKSDMPFNWYGGVLTGAYIYTKTIGTEYGSSWTGDGYVSGSSEIDMSGKSFYDSFYMGFLIGFKTLTKSGSFVKPSFEFSFLPGFVNISSAGYHSESEDYSKSMALFSVILGFGHKKSHPN
jgi:hypothetical protein